VFGFKLWLLIRLVAAGGGWAIRHSGNTREPVQGLVYSGFRWPEAKGQVALGTAERWMGENISTRHRLLGSWSS